MIVPSIDLMDGQAVQLIGGEERALEAGDPRPIAEKFGTVGEIAVIDLDAALGRGSNEEVIKDLLKIAKCRVGGGIRSVEAAIKWLDAGAEKVILGTAATPEVLSELPKERVLAALDTKHGEVVVEGWTKKTGSQLFHKIEELNPYVGGFLVTFVETEGRMQGIGLDRVREVARATGRDRLTVAGGITKAEEIATIDWLGADSQVGMALYTGKLDLADAFTAPVSSDRADGYWPTIVCDERGVALGLTYSNVESVREAIKQRRGVYWSRKRGLWEKGKESGDYQDLIRIEVDCDRDTLKFTVHQRGTGFCHKGTRTCFGPERGIGDLFRRLEERKESAPQGSYTRRLLEDADLLSKKLREEAEELNAAKTKDEAAWEAADVMYFTLVSLVKAGVPLEKVEAELARRAMKVTRRPGNAKE